MSLDIRESLREGVVILSLKGRLTVGEASAVREQVSIDRPPGVRALHGQLQARYGDVHAAEHVLMEALGETLWRAQHAGGVPDESRYLELARRRLAKG